MMPWLVKMINRVYRRVEELEAGDDTTGLAPELCTSSEMVVEQAKLYEKY